MPILSRTKYLLFPIMITGVVILSGCNKNKEETASNNTATQQTPHSDQSAQQIQTFPTTAQDEHDIQLIENFDERFSAMTDDMENELAQMQQQGTLDAAFERNRKLDHVESALTMLKELDLQTAQGRYIQGLLYQYWEIQGQHLNQQTSSANADKQPKDNSITAQDLSDYLKAQQQLAHWKAQQNSQSQS